MHSREFQFGVRKLKRWEELVGETN